MSKISKKELVGMIGMLRISNCIPRWSRYVQHGYTEIAKQGLNAQIAYLMYLLLEKEGKKIDYTRLPLIAIRRCYEKTEKCDIVEENYDKLFCNNGLREAFDEYLRRSFSDITSKSFSELVWSIPENCLEWKAFKAATAIATYIEFQEIRRFMSCSDVYEVEVNVYNRLEKYKDFPIVKDILGEGEDNCLGLVTLFKSFSMLRNRIRWVRYITLKEYSDLGHSFDVSVLSYLLTLAREPGNFEKATKGFVVGLYHDLAENWTGDMPSPIKDKIPGLRKATEILELEMLEKHVYKLLCSKGLDGDFRKVMLENLPIEEKLFFKEGDSLAATIEAATQVVGGSREKRFREIVNHDAVDPRWSDPARIVLQYLLEEIG